MMWTTLAMPFAVIAIIGGIIYFGGIIYYDRLTQNSVPNSTENAADDCSKNGTQDASTPSLYPCPDCGNPVSLAAQMCPKCGRILRTLQSANPINPMKDETNYGRLMVAIIVTVIAGVAVNEAILKPEVARLEAQAIQSGKDADAMWQSVAIFRKWALEREEGRR